MLIWRNGQLLLAPSDDTGNGGVDDDQGDDDATGDDGEGSDGSGGGNEDKPVSSGDVSKIVANELRKARKKWNQELGDKLGGRSTDDVAAILAATDAKAEAEKTEVERAREAAAKAEAAAQAAESSKAAASRQLALVRALTTDQGESGEDPVIRPDRMDMAVSLIESQGWMEGEDDEGEAVAGAISKLRESSPEWFGSSDDGSGASQNGGTPTLPKRTGKETKNSKKSPWDVGAADAKSLIESRRSSAFSTSD